MDEGGPKKNISARTPNHFAVWNLPILGLSSDYTKKWLCTILIAWALASGSYKQKIPENHAQMG